MEINGIWLNDTQGPFSVTVNGLLYSGIVQANGRSQIMKMALNDLMMLDVVLTASDVMSNPKLLWVGSDVEDLQILQQVARNEDWAAVKISDRSNLLYVFHVQGDGGMMIVGTVELVDEDLMTA